VRIRTSRGRDRHADILDRQGRVDSCSTAAFISISSGLIMIKRATRASPSRWSLWTAYWVPHHESRASSVCCLIGRLLIHGSGRAVRSG